jgi:hypothetical protein
MKRREEKREENNDDKRGERNNKDEETNNIIFIVSLFTILIASFFPLSCFFLSLSPPSLLLSFLLFSSLSHLFFIYLDWC